MLSSAVVIYKIRKVLIYARMGYYFFYPLRNFKNLVGGELKYVNSFVNSWKILTFALKLKTTMFNHFKTYYYGTTNGFN